MALDRKVKNEDFQEKRIDLLKAQIHKQQAYIKKLTSLLQSTQKSFKELYACFEFLLYLQQKKPSPTFVMPENEELLLQKVHTLEEKAISDRIQTGFLSKEAKEQFMSNFLSVFDKVQFFEKKNEEFLH